MIDLIKYQLESLSEQRSKLEAEIRNIDFNELQGLTNRLELNSQIIAIDGRIDSLLDRIKQ